MVRTLSSYETSLCSLPARVPVLERELHGGFHGFGTARRADDRLEVRSALRQQQMGQLFEWLAAEKISVSACDLRELTRDRRVHLGVAVADAERGRAAISPPSVPSNGISTVPVDTCVTASCFAANRLIAPELAKPRSRRIAGSFALEASGIPISAPGR